MMEWIRRRKPRTATTCTKKLKSEAEWRKKIHGYRALMEGRRFDQGEKRALCHP